MATTAVLSLGIVFLYEAFFRSLDAYNYYRSFLEVVPWADEKIWLTQEALRESGARADIDKDGQFNTQGKVFRWNVSYGLLDSSLDSSLYKIDLALSWKEGKRQLELTRAAYALYEEKK